MDPIEQLRPHCTAVGFDLGTAGHVLFERLRRMAGRSKTFDDALKMAGYADRVFHFYATKDPPHAFTIEERRTVVLASLFSDIGKTGPADAGPEAQQFVVDVFAVENVKNDQQPLGEFLRTYFPDSAAQRTAAFAALGIDPALPIREFWNLHSQWTLSILEKAGVPPEAVAAAATHHLLDNVNPEAIVGEDDRFTRRFGNNAAFDRPEKLVIVLDKYDAARRRGRLTHEKAIAWLREKIATNARFKDDAALQEMVDIVARALADE